jgi:hypothetical protein
MTRMLTGALAGTALLLSLGASSPAHADTVVGVRVAPRVSVGVAVAPAPVRVVRRPARPGPNYHWVEGHWRRDAYGHRDWVAGHWQRNRVVTTRRVVVVR